jgi:hypothetical protein
MARRVTVSQSWPPGFRKPAIRGKPITGADQTLGNSLDIPDAQGGKVSLAASLKCQAAERPDGFHRHKPLLSGSGWG